MSRHKQLSFNLKSMQAPSLTFGGDLLKNCHAKRSRPLSTQLPLHVVLRATTSCLRTLRHYQIVNHLVYTIAKKYRVRVYEYANVGSHLHLLLKLDQLEDWSKFIRELTGRISQTVQGLQGSQRSSQKFWLHRPFTRVIRSWRRAFENVKAYIHLNQWESEGHIDRRVFRTMADWRRAIESS